MLLAATVALLLLAPQDSARVQATLSARRIAAGSTAVLSIEVETAGSPPDEIPVPVLPPGLELGPISDFSQLQVAFPGGRRRVTRREIVVRGTSPGVYRIPEIAIRVAGRILRTAPLQLAVDPAQRPPGPAAGSGVTLRALATPDNVFVGEQVRYQVEATFPEEMRLRQTRVPDFEPPVAPGFWTYDLPQPVTVSLRMTRGEAAEVQEFRQILFPLNPGEQVIPPARLQYEVRQGLLFTPELHALATGSVPVHVHPLPPGAPATFRGAVGSYGMDASLSASRAAAGEPVTLRIAVEGSGNIKALVRPTLDTIPGVDSYEGSEHVEVGFANGLLSGRKTFEWTLVPRTTGRPAVPPVEFSWFVPGLRRYRVARTTPLLLEVSAPVRGPGATELLEPIRTAPSSPLIVTRSWGFAAAQLVPPVLLVLLWAERGRRRRRARQLAEQARELDHLQELRGQPRACLEQLALWLRNQERNPDAARLRAAVRQALYGPEPVTAARCDEFLRAAASLPTTRHRSGPMAGLALLLLGAGAAGHLVGAEDSFARGVAAYRAGAYREATAAFVAHLRVHPRDPAAWYDLGNAAYQSDEPGRASWAWLKALQLQPRDRLARHNLQLADAGDAQRLVAPRVPLADEEAATLAAILWWLAAGCFALALVRPRRRLAAGRAGAILLLLLLPLCALLIARAAAPERAVTLTSAALQSAPSARADTLRALPPGAPLIVRARRGDWLLARAADLREGWIERGRVGELEWGGPDHR